MEADWHYKYLLNKLLEIACLKSKKYLFLRYKADFSDRRGQLVPSFHSQVMDLKEKIEEIVSSILSQESLADELFIVDIQVAGVKSLPKITVLLDGDKGIDIDVCALVSRKLGYQIEELNLIDSAYTLEVSSPGLDQPLKLKRQYIKNIGRKVKVLLKNGETKSGRLDAVQEDSILVVEEVKGKKKDTSSPNTEIALKDIEKTNVLVSFNE